MKSDEAGQFISLASSFRNSIMRGPDKKIMYWTFVSVPRANIKLTTSNFVGLFRPSLRISTKTPRAVIDVSGRSRKYCLESPKIAGYIETTNAESRPVVRLNIWRPMP